MSVFYPTCRLAASTRPAGKTHAQEYATNRIRNQPELGLLLLLYLAASYSLIFLDERFLYPRIPVLIFSLAVIPEGIASFFQNRPARFSSISALLLSALSAVAFASPVIYLASLEVNPLNLFHR